MKAYTSREMFDERSRYTAVREQMGQVRLDSEANEQADLVRTDARRRSADIAEGSPDDGFLITDTHLLDPIRSLDGWTAVGLAADDERAIAPQLRLTRRDPETLPHVLRTRGHTAVTRRLPAAVDLLRLPVPLHPDAATYQAAGIVLQIRFERPPTDDELVEIRVVMLDADGAAHEVASVPAPPTPTSAQQSAPWTLVRVPASALEPLRRGTGAEQTLLLRGWGLLGLPPRAFVDIDALLAVDGGLGDGDVVIRGGDGTIAGAGRIFLDGLRSFIEHDWRYSLQPDLPDPVPLVRPPGVTPTDHQLMYLDVWERPVHAFQDPSLLEPALGGEQTSFRSQKVTQVRMLPVAGGGSEALRAPIGGGLLTTNVRDLPDRFPVQERDPCRDRCLFTANVSTGEGYRGSANINVRVELLVAGQSAGPGAGPHGIVGWSRDNGSRVAPLVVDATAGAQVVFVAPEDARFFAAGDLVVVEDERSRLDPERDVHRADLRALRAVNTATGELELEPQGHTLTTDPVPLEAGGALTRSFSRADAAAVRRWDGADHLLTGVRYNLADGIDFAFSGNDFRVGEYWTFTARVAGPDAVAQGVVQQLTRAPVHGPVHRRVPVGRVRWTAAGREFDDLRVHFLPLHEVRDRLIELGARQLAPGAFTVVVGDGRRTFGDIDQNLREGVTGDEALQAALDRLGADGGAIYVRAGDYRLEHPVLVQGRSRLRILGDGAASLLQVTGAGGAFHFDGCGQDGELSIELLALAETPQLQTPIGVEPPTGPPVLPFPVPLPVELPVPLPLPVGPGPVAPQPGVTVRPILLTDLTAAVPAPPDLIAGFAAQLRVIGPFDGRVAESVVATIGQLRRLQRARPGRPLEEVAPAELEVLRRLPHGVVTAADSRRIRLADLTITSREQGQAEGTVAAGVLISGTCAEITVTGCRLQAPSGVVATAYARSLTPSALTRWPRSGLFLHDVTIRDNVLTASGAASYGVRIADGTVDGLVVAGNRIDGFGRGIAIEDAAETRSGEAIDRSVVRDNVVTGSSLIGIAVSGDGVDVEANEIRLDPAPATGQPAAVRAGVQVTGVANRVRECWITLPAQNASALPVLAGIVVGAGVDAADVGRPVHDVAVTGNRIDGAGGPSCGVLVGGSQTCFDVRIRENVLRDLGDAGVRVWAHAGSVGAVRVQDNDIQNVARDYLSWGPQVVAEIGALAPGVALPAGGTPQDVLQALLAQPTGVQAALDATLRWLERATLRGGVVLSLAEQCEVRGNRISSVGSSAIPAGFVAPGADIRTAGVASSGANDLVVEGNIVRGVHAPARVVQLPAPPTGPIRPPILDLLGSRGLLADAPGSVLGVFGPAVALRRELMEYTAGDARTRQRLGGRIYAAMDSLGGALEAGGPESRRLAVELQGGVAEMLEAQGTAEHTRSAHHVRATLSRAATLTAPDDVVARAWDTAARFDAALIGDDAAAVAVAGDVVETGSQLTEGLESLGIDPTGKAQAVIAATGSARARLRAQLDLAAALGDVAQARARKTDLQQAAGAASLSGSDRTIADGIIGLTLTALEVPDPAQLNADAVRSVTEGGASLVEVLQGSHAPLAERVATDLARLRVSGGQPGTADITRLAATLREVRLFAQGAAPATDLRADDIDAQQAQFHGELIALTADQLERRIGGLAADPELAATRNLRLLDQAAGQLVNLVGPDPQAQSTAREVRAAVGAALSDVSHRAEHQSRARALLRELAAPPGGGSGGSTSGSGSAVTSAVDGSATDPAEPLAAIGELLLTVRERTSDAEILGEATGLLDAELQRAATAAGLGTAERTFMLAGVPGQLAALAAPGTGSAARAAAVHALAGVVEQLAYRATQRPAASPQTRAAHALAGGLTRALDPALGEPDRLSSVSRWVNSRADSLSTTLAGAVNAAPTLPASLAAIRKGIGSLLLLPTIPALPTAALAVEAEVADGIYLAATGRRLEVRRNELTESRLGATIVGPDDHALAPLAPDVALALTVAENQITGTALGALDIRPGAAGSVAVIGNSAAGCCGATNRTLPEYGQSVVAVTGSGDLLVADNRLRDNGNGRSERSLHELLLDWDGDVTVRGNYLRHAGSPGGGAGLVVLSGAVPASLLRSLTLQPALVVEPAARQGIVGGVRPGLGAITGGNDLLAAGLGAQRSVLDASNTFGVAGFRLATRELAPSFAVLTAGVSNAPGTDLAQSAADGWLQTQTVPVTTTSTLLPLLNFLGVIRPPIIVVRPAVRRSVQVGGNSVVANGPALLLLAEGTPLVAATVVDNEFESLAATGAVYLRGVDTTVFAANRCESQREVNVVVVRVRASLVSLTGNTAAGDQPAPPMTPPTIPPRDPLPTEFGDLHLTVPVGAHASLNLRLDPEAVLAAIDTRRSTSFRDVADDSQATFNLFAKRQNIAVDPDVVSVLASAGANAGLGFRFRGTLADRIEAFRPLVPGAERLVGRTDPAAVDPAGVAAADVAAADVADPVTGEPNPVEKALRITNSILSSAELPGSAKLFGLAVSSGLPDHQARALVQTQLARSGGDQQAALTAGLAELTGISAVGGESVTERIEAASPVEDLVSLLLRNRRFTAVGPVSPPIVAPAPDPRAHSIVVLGGSRVGAVNNITTAGVHVHDAAHSAENNV